MMGLELRQEKPLQGRIPTSHPVVLTWLFSTTFFIFAHPVVDPVFPHFCNFLHRRNTKPAKCICWVESASVISICHSNGADKHLVGWRGWRTCPRCRSDLVLKWKTLLSTSQLPPPWQGLYDGRLPGRASACLWGKLSNSRPALRLQRLLCHLCQREREVGASGLDAAQHEQRGARCCQREAVCCWRIHPAPMWISTRGASVLTQVWLECTVLLGPSQSGWSIQLCCCCWERDLLHWRLVPTLSLHLCMSRRPVRGGRADQSEPRKRLLPRPSSNSRHRHWSLENRAEAADTSKKPRLHLDRSERPRRDNCGRRVQRKGRQAQLSGVS